MTTPRRLGPNARPRAHAADVAHVERAGPRIAELGADLDLRLESEARPSERLRLLREATNQITRTANDAIHAYRRARQALERELRRSDANVPAVHALQARLSKARLDVLEALADADGRYSSSDSPTREYAERDGVWHITDDGTARCGAETGEPLDLGGAEPKPLCSRCQERSRDP